MIRAHYDGARGTFHVEPAFLEAIDHSESLAVKNRPLLHGWIERLGQVFNYPPRRLDVIIRVVIQTASEPNIGRVSVQVNLPGEVREVQCRLGHDFGANAIEGLLLLFTPPPVHFAGQTG